MQIPYEIFHFPEKVYKVFYDNTAKVWEGKEWEAEYVFKSALSIHLNSIFNAYEIFIMTAMIINLNKSQCSCLMTPQELLHSY